ncbi:hypothetical protein BU25DRAFT_136408 [Macroventuria anomochaeta]|uniref:Uncharacterized protein n=1 Tax=Macroventuria anomochaeta TaxID=301207 RepID=A0ACB6SF59_9PLEO|nr:uncharacterized protein BU25DRAFT_136408 [Macroventuria anomochaeta]KAF2631949.1 hypothetical protein BU25DRAFT_136408 [Macroventuria anomochaeta]
MCTIIGLLMLRSCCRGVMPFFEGLDMETRKQRLSVRLNLILQSYIQQFMAEPPLTSHTQDVGNLLMVPRSTKGRVFDSNIERVPWCY